MSGISLRDRVFGCLIGSAVGDALGSPTECWDYRNIRKQFGNYRSFGELEAAVAKKNLTAPWGAPIQVGKVTDDTTLSDLLLDAIIANEGQITAYEFAKCWEHFGDPVIGPDGEKVVRLDLVHYIEQIPYLRNRFDSIPKRELGHGEANATNAVMFIAPVGLLCAGDPLRAELMAVDVSAVNQHGSPRDVAGGYCAALAACFLPGMTVEHIIELALQHTRHRRHCLEMQKMLELARTCETTEQYIERYYVEIIGKWIPYVDDQHEMMSNICVTWNSSEILGNALAALRITKGRSPAEMMLMCAKLGRDCDTICRIAGGLIGCLNGIQAIPRDWIDYVLERNRWLRLEEKAERMTQILEADLKQRQKNLANTLRGA